MSAKRVARKKATKKKKARPAAKKRARRVAKKAARRAPKKAVQRAPKRRLPRKEDVPGYSPGLPDMARWPDVAIVLKVEPFYAGPDAVPFSRLRAHLVPDPTDRNRPKNDFYLTHDQVAL